jgi:hypothetical protein
MNRRMDWRGDLLNTRDGAMTYRTNGRAELLG